MLSITLSPPQPQPLPRPKRYQYSKISEVKHFILFFMEWMKMRFSGNTGANEEGGTTLLHTYTTTVHE
jgi:hypothetical protein